MRSPRRVTLLLAITSVLACRGIRQDDSADDTRVTSALTSVTYNVSIQTPPQVPATAVVLGSMGSTLLGGGTKILGQGTTPSVTSNMGSGGLDAEPDGVLGTVWSTSTVTLKDRVHATGKVFAPSLVQGNGVHVDGGLDTATPRTPATVTTWTVVYPAIATAPDVILQPNQTGTQPPGRYGTVSIAAGAKLTLSTGTYYLASLDLEPSAKIVLNQDAGPVLIYVQGSPILRGTFTTTSGAAPDPLLGCLGTAEVFVEAPFVGTIVAPSAKLTLRSVSGGHTGAFFAKNIEVGPSPTTVTFRPGHVILTTQPPTSPETCVAAIKPNDALTGTAREVQYQRDILRFCTGTGIGACEQTIRARMNVDFAIAAAEIFTSRITTGTYVALLRDREAKLVTFRNNPTLACNVAAHDGDGDYVPDGTDACPNTPPLTPVLANGCTNTNVPDGPDRDAVQRGMTTIGVNADPRCNNAPDPTTPSPLGAFRNPPDPSKGKAIWLSRDPGVTTCPLYYQIEVFLSDGSPPKSLTFLASEDTTLPWITRPSGAVQFNIHATDAGNRGAWANYGVYTDTFRVRAFNLAGQKSLWSDFFRWESANCVAGQACQDQ